MRGLLSVPAILLGIVLSAAQAQPGPEVPPEPVAPVAVVPADPSPVPSATAPIETPEVVPAAVETEIPEAAAPPVVFTPESDPLAIPAPEPVPVAGSTSVDSAPASNDSKPAGVAVSDSAAIPDASKDSLANAARVRMETSRRRSHMGMGSDFRTPPGAVAMPAPPPKVEDLTPYDDEHGGGRKLKSDPRASKLYRSPRKAFFYSLVLPGAGQAWVGSYVRASVFVAAEAGLLYGWYDISIRQARAKTRESERFADAHWSASRYEAIRKTAYDTVGRDNWSKLASAMPYRSRYCDALYSYDQNTLRDACNDVPDDTATNYKNHVETFADAGLSAADVHAKRVNGIKDLPTFYERIGRDEEFVTGWEDATSDTVSRAGLLLYDDYLNDKDPNTVPSAAPWGVSQMRAQYLGMRRDADKLAATQGWFLGGLVLNHLLAAVDAALDAQRSNRKLYDEERTSWTDGLHVQGGLAWLNGPATRADMILDF